MNIVSSTRAMGIPRPIKPPRPKFADGGGVMDESVPIYAADGEYVLDPETVAGIGIGDMRRGHDLLDEWVKLELANAAKTLRNLPGPRKS